MFYFVICGIKDSTYYSEYSSLFEFSSVKTGLYFDLSKGKLFRIYVSENDCRSEFQIREMNKL